MKYLSPRSDVGFKKLFGNPHHKNLTISFLNSILDRKGSNLITEVKFADTEQLPESIDGRKSFFDIYCTDGQGNKFIIEMQGKYQAHFMVRAQYYAGFALSRQMHAAPFKYEKLVPVIFIGVLDHILFDKIDDVITRHALMDIKNHTTSSIHQMFHIIELKKFKKTIDQLDSEIDEWLFFMNQADEFEQIPEELQASEKFKEAFEVLERMRWTERELDEYLAEADAAGYMDRVLEGAEERATQKGLQKGLEQGALKEKETVAIHGLKKGLDINLIQELTGLSIKEIEQLREKI
ncbi:MAG: Rpn family recombination-promoting nuclease/putative transposase [Candidatus Chromulinivorax sp.]|nr:Rpn family recombination-promoting nuclease/putative transposase [Candidatus Chromulinivorax sp.]